MRTYKYTENAGETPVSLCRKSCTSGRSVLCSPAVKHSLSLFLAALALSLTACQTQFPKVSSAPALYMPEGLCYLDEVAPTIQVELKYAGSDNFVGRPIEGYSGQRAILRKDAAANMAKAAAILAKDGYGLKVLDAYRPAGAMKDFYEWSKTDDDRMKARFYPNITKKGIYDGQYIGLTSEHNWGVAVDVTLIDLKSGKECDMGGHHDLLDPCSATDYPNLTPRQRANRNRLRSAMAAAGMRNYSKEWWHYFVHPLGICYLYGFPLDDNLSPAPSAQ